MTSLTIESLSLLQRVICTNVSAAELIKIIIIWMIWDITLTQIGIQEKIHVNYKPMLLELWNFKV